MKKLAEVVLAFFDLAEAEGRLLQARVLVTVRSCLWFALGVVFAGAAIALFLASAFDWLLTVLPRPVALALTGLASAVVSLVFLGGAYLCLKKKNVQHQKPESIQN